MSRSGKLGQRTNRCRLTSNIGGEHEIATRLSREEHRGRHYFWFNEERFSQKWFQSSIEEAIKNAGPRYTPELNVNLPIAHLFEGLGRTEFFFCCMAELRGKLVKEHAKLRRSIPAELGEKPFEFLSDEVNALRQLLLQAEQAESYQIDLNVISAAASKSRRRVSECLESLSRIRQAADARKASGQEADSKSKTGNQDFGYLIYHLHKLNSALHEIKEFFDGSATKGANVAALLLLGSAGTGKSHLFCDIAKQRVAAKLPTILLLGQQFAPTEPWSQITQLLGVDCSKEELLGALEAAAQARNGRALILVDGLNEGDGKLMWYQHLAGVITAVRRFPRLAIAFSVRTSYVDLVVPPALREEELVKETHLGFIDHEYEATKKFFDYYGIERPAVPLLFPEFQNPMFLGLFCKGLRNRGYTKIPPGLRGVTSIFELFLDSVNRKLAKVDSLDYDALESPVQKAIQGFAEALADRGVWWLPRDEARDLVNGFLPGKGYEKTLFRQLISEGVFSEDRFWSGRDNGYQEGIRFSYERLTDSLTAQVLINRYLDVSDLVESFKPDGPLGSLFSDERKTWMNSGLIEALSVQIPEKLGKELTELAPYCSDFEVVQRAFLLSLIFRSPKAISNRTLDYINDHIVPYRNTGDEFWDTLLTLASVPEHPYNADFIHNQLMKFALADRDEWWSKFLYRQYGERSAVDRLVEWAWSPEDKSHIEDESIRLAAATLAWFLATSNRYLRDRTTKALITLLSTRINVLRQILKMFQDVNDPYVLERLLAVAYGCAIRCRNKGQLDEMAREVYEMYFQDREPPPAFLLRDYARGVIETALRSGKVPGIDPQKVKPPYRSEWPQRIPDKEELEKFGEWHKEMPDEEFGRVEIYSSVMGMGDFARYIIGTNSGSFDWSSRRLGEPPKPSKEQARRAFVKSLTKAQRRLWNAFESAQNRLREFRFSQILATNQSTKTGSTEIRLEKKLKRAERSFCRSLGNVKLNTFESLRTQRVDSQDDFDLTLAQRWILAKVFDLGWTTERFGKFDRNVNLYRYGREANKVERIGKKYQWIAYHEFLARVSDNFEFKGEPWSEKKEKFEGAWQTWARDIDPSFLLTKTKGEDSEPDTKAWWFRSSYDAWDVEPNDAKWTQSATDLPSVEPLLQVQKPEDRTDWLVMETFYKWEQPTPIEEDRFDFPRRQIWYMLKSYVVKRDRMEEIFAWAAEQNYMGRWMPESQELHRVFLGEFHWAPAYTYHNQRYYGQFGWTRGDHNEIPAEILPTTNRYTWSGMEYDCSLDDSISMYLPCGWIAHAMGLHCAEGEGRYYDKRADLIAFDPSVDEIGPSALLMHKESLLEFLHSSSYDIFWTMCGEKQVIGGWNYPKGWVGRLTINGAFAFQNGSISGDLSTMFEDYSRQR